MLGGSVVQPPSLSQALINFWINFSTVTVNGSYNVASITNNATGDTTITFTQAFAATAYALLGMGQSNALAGNGRVSIKLDTMPTASSVRVMGYNVGAGVFENLSIACVAGIGLGGSVAPAQENQVSAWVQFDASSTTPVIQQAFNVASLTDNAGGDAGVNFTQQYAASQYCAVGFAGNSTDASVVGYNMLIKQGVIPTVSGLSVIASLGNQSAGRDITKNSVLIIGRY